MPGRESLVRTLWLLSSLALLAWVLVAPTRNSGSGAVSSQADCPRGHFDLAQTEPTAQIRAGKVADVDSEGSALACEDEEQEWVDVLIKPRASFLITSSLRKAPAPQLISPPTVISHYPIRC